MKFLIPIIFVFSSLSFLLHADEEIEIIENLITATQKNLHAQQETLTALIKFKQARHAFIEDPTSRRLATHLVKSAIVVQKHIETEHLTHLFSPEFLMEIKFFNQLGTRPTP